MKSSSQKTVQGRIRMKRSGAARPWMESSQGIGRSRSESAKVFVKKESVVPPETDLPKAKVSAEEKQSEVKVSPEMSKASGSQVKTPIEVELPNLPVIAKVISKFGEIYNGFESEGDENIPDTGGALIVFYHGLIPLDAWYYGLQHYIKTGRLIRGLGDRWLFKTPVLKELVQSVGAKEGNPKTAVDLLKGGELVGVSPGGVKEAVAGTAKNYQLVWGHREGFARVATEAQVPVIPAFTVNVESLYRSPFSDHPIFQTLYEATRLPLVPIVGLGPLPFPVKIKTVIGPPIPFDPNRTPKELVAETRQALEQLIAKHQPQETSVFKGMKDRFLNRRG
ncbi:MAG: acyltransferase family protein [Bdellovibrionales bacterium]|nr:acyltransferase family protein [Bdellovibrionales bacterium]